MPPLRPFVVPRPLVLAILALLSFVAGARPAGAGQLVAPGSLWKYNDKGIDLGTAWRALDFADAAWMAGRGQLGYGDGDEATVLSYGGNVSSRFPTYYFRHAFSVADPKAFSALTLHFLRDDGCVIYVNGIEVARSNMPGGPIAYATLASAAVADAGETTWQQAPLDPALLRAGTNVVAVEVHQSGLASSDVSFDLELMSTDAPAGAASVTLLSPANQSVTNSGSVTMTGSATDAAGLASATLHVSGAPYTITRSGPGQVEDTYISADQPGSNFGAAAAVKVDGSGPHAHALVKFPGLIGTGAGQVPAGATIASAILRVNCTNPGNVFKAYRLLEDWVEGEANWTRRSNAAVWTVPGADGAGSNAGAALSGDCTIAGLRSVDITAFVQEWTSGAANAGIVLVEGGTDGLDFDSSESATSPVLTVSFQNASQAVETVPLAGTTAPFTFTTTLAPGQAYAWNVLVTTTDGRQVWAPSSFQLTVDSSAPDDPVLVAPADGSSATPLSPVLSVSVSDPDSAAVDVTFTGRPALAAPEFTIVALPDTQHYSESFPGIFTAQTQWIAQNVASRNIAFVTHLGDIVNQNNVDTQWQAANSSMSLLDGVVPYGMGPGNHDLPTTLFNQYFPYTRYEGETWYGGHLADKNDDNFQLFSAGGVDFLIVHLEFCPPPAAITWADSVLKTHPDRTAIITTHGYLGLAADRYVHVCGSTQYLWDSLAVPNPNVRFMFSGHVHGEARRTDLVNGRAVHQVLADYQDRASGGEGWLRILRFVPAENRIYVQTYSPWLNRFETDADSQFTLDFDMGGMSTIAARTAVASGGVASVTWPNLAPATEYEWSATVADETGKSRTGPAWRFTTGGAVPNQPPTAQPQAVTTPEDTPVPITLSAVDPDGTPLTYTVVSGPARGALSGTAPELTYRPHANLSGADSFTFRVSDGQASSQATVTISVLGINDAPVAVSDTYTVAPGGTLSVGAAGVLGNDSDLEATPLQASLVDPPLSGAVTLAPDGAFTYVPVAGFSGTDSFTYTATDGAAASNVATVTIAVTAPVVPPPPVTNLALGRPATASTAPANAKLAVDGSAGTRWASAVSDPQWIRVDLGTAQAIARVKLVWEAAYALAYRIQVSNDATNWTDVYTTTTGDGGIDDVPVAATARYVRMYGTKRATAYGYSLWELEVYGPGTTPSGTNLVTNPEFDGGMTGWTLWTDASVGASATASVVPTDLSTPNALQVAIANGGTSDWRVQVQQPRAIVTGKTYQISFMAKAAAAKAIRVVIQQEGGAWTEHFSKAVTVGTAAATYGPFPFTPSVTDATSRLKFYVGANTTTVHIDKVTITE
jgi:hypothetical protein